MLAQTFQPTYQTYGPPQLEYPGFQNQAESAIYNQVCFVTKCNNHVIPIFSDRTWR